MKFRQEGEKKTLWARGVRVEFIEEIKALAEKHNTTVGAILNQIFEEVLTID